MSRWLCLAPQEALGLLREMVPRDANAGLTWARCLGMWEGTQERPRTPKPIKPVLDAFAEGFNQRGQGPRNPARDLLRLHRERLQRALRHWAGRRQWRIGTFSATVSRRLVTGLGNSHPTAANLSCDTIIGVPFLTGSAVKGLTRRAAELLDEPESEVERLFGPDVRQAEDKARQGEVTFFDAYPRRWPTLVVDVVNRHHPNYYAERERFPEPLETESPVPVSFLCIGEGTEFVFHLAAETDSDFDRAEELLNKGLSTLGIGAKTAVGYGIMTPVGERITGV